LKLLIFILNKVEMVDTLLKKFTSENISGATIANTRGMLQKLMSDDDLNIIGSFRHLINPKRSENKTIFMVVKEEKIKEIVEIIESIVGSLDEPDSGLLFTIPIDYVRGYKQ